MTRAGRPAAAYLLMDRITSRKNSIITHVRALAVDGACRREKGQYLCDGIKTLKEALAFGVEVCLVLWKEQAQQVEGLLCREQYILPAELFDYASTMKNSPGPLFAVAMPERNREAPLKNAVILENVQNPTNVGAIFRSAAALGMDAVLLTPGCSDPLYRRSARVSMGTVFQIPWTFTPPWPGEGMARLEALGFATAALALREDTLSIDDPRLRSEERLAVLLGSEGDGLTEDTIARCRYTVKIPMYHGVDSLNVAAASAVAFWELRRKTSS